MSLSLHRNQLSYCNRRVNLHKGNKRLWRKNGNGGANRTYGPFKVCYGAIVHRPDDEADERYPDASIWSRTLPVRNAIFKDDIHEDAIHTDLVVSVSD